jgi:ATP-dependent DNA ligase
MLTETGTGDTIDAWITGYTAGEGKNEGKVGSIEFSINMQCNDGSIIIHKIAYIGGIDDALRDDMTVIDENGNVTLNPKYYGKVAEIDGYGISSRAKRLRHAVLIRFRNDKSIDECIYTEQFINSMIL